LIRQVKRKKYIMKIARALISVSDKTGIVEFAQCLHELGVEILSTGGTATLLHQANIPVIEVAEYTGSPEILDGRVKTLHPLIHGGILGRRDLPSHTAQMQAHGIKNIDLVCVNLYPFEATIAKPNVSLEEAIENIDIGGPTMIRSAAKNHMHVAVVTQAEDYALLMTEMQAQQGALSLATRRQLAFKAFSHTAAYDSAISNYLTRLTEQDTLELFPTQLNINVTLAQRMRYGENPHQQAAFYRDRQSIAGKIASYTQSQGKALSFNNIADADAAWECVKTFDAPACVIVKHANPCGVAIADSIYQAYQQAFATDPSSAFGGIIAFNQEVDIDTAQAVSAQFLEVLIAPGYSAEAQAHLAKKTNVRVLTIPLAYGINAFDIKQVGGGLLVQTPDAFNIGINDLQVVSERQPTAQQLQDLLFAWRVAKYVKSNAIVFCGQGRTLGIGAGQMSRVDATRIAAFKAKNAGLSLTGSVAASDAFFPFSDGVDVIAENGIQAIIQPGGSVRDEEVFATANAHGIVMVLTGIRHFRH
jgi:phosphoribosylaminoimidazolecarboxamide formyltransferase/IMP cyclohydrolase